MVTGPAGTGKSTALDSSGLAAPFSRSRPLTGNSSTNCRWLPFENGLILDIKGNLVLREDGQTSDEKEWNSLLRQLQRHRPQRPLDGIVLTLDCNDLLRDDPDTAARKAGSIYKKLWQAQKELGLRLPVYILTTKCDRLEGFSGLCREIPRSFKNNMLGWSSPYSGETSYSTAWADEAFDSINRNLIRIKYELFARGPEPRGLDELFLFNTGFARLRGPVGIYLDGLFKQSAYHESFIFRGVYFCGDGGPDLSSSSPAGRYFVKDLFEKKVFPESGLARPLAAVLISRNRLVRGLQIAAVLLAVMGFFGLWWAGGVIQRDKIPINNILRSIETDLEYIQASRQSDLLIKNGTFPNSVYDLLNGMAEIRTNKLQSFLVPASWYSRVDANITECVARAYREIIMATIRMSLKKKAVQIIDPKDRTASTSALDLLIKSREDQAPVVTPVLLVQTPEYLVLDDYVQSLTELELNIEIFNQLAQAGENDLSGLSGLVKYLYGLELPKNFYTQAGYYEETLARITMKPIYISNYRPQASAKAQTLLGRFYHVAFHRNPLVMDLGKLAAYLDSMQNIDSCPTRDCIVWGLLESIQRLEQGLEKVDLESVLGSPPQLWLPLRELLKRIGQTEFLGQPLATEAEKIANEQLGLVHDQWLNLEKQYSGKLIQSGGQSGKMVLTDYLKAIKQGLIDLWQQDFTGSDLIKAPPIVIPPAARFRWNTAFLKRASDLVVSYDNYSTGGYAKFPPDLRTSMDMAARVCLEKTTLKFISRASSPVSVQYGYDDRLTESEALAEAGNFRDASPSLSFLLDSYFRLGLNVGRDVLSKLTHWQTSTILGAIDRELEEEGLYQPDITDLNRWALAADLALAAFDVTDQKELEYYLTLRRQRVDYLAGYAKALVDFYHNSPMDRKIQDGTLFFKWGLIQANLAAYKANKPDNSITELEKYILFQVGKINLSNFYRMITPADLGAHSSDYFLERKNELRRILHEQCKNIASGKLNNKYEAIKNYFNNFLAGRFPFAETPAEEEIEAAPEDIKQFYRLFDLYATDIKNVLTPETRTPAIDFLDQMDSVRPVFASYLDSKPKAKPAEKDEKQAPKNGGDKEEKDQGRPAPVKPAEPVLNFSVQFRVNRSMEENANKIIEWTLTVGEYKNIDDGTVQNGCWAYADPVTVILRWARDSGYRPDPAAVQEPVRVFGKTIVYQFANKWALLSLLKEYASDLRDFPKQSDPQPYTLKFRIATLNQAEPSAEPEKLETVAFIRLTPLGPDQKPIVVPSFPVKAPPWD